MLMYENDEIHVTGVGLVNLASILDPANPLSEDIIQAPPGFDVSYFGMNSNEPPFDDVKVRQALNYAIDKATLAKVLLEDLVVPANGILPPALPGYTPPAFEGVQIWGQSGRIAPHRFDAARFFRSHRWSGHRGHSPDVAGNLGHRNGDIANGVGHIS